MQTGTPTHTGARTVLGTVPQLTPLQWLLVQELLVKEQQRVLATQRDKAEEIQQAINMGPLLDRYLSNLADLRELITLHTGITR